jgi:AcrR family transcriptional regulator
MSPKVIDTQALEERENTILSCALAFVKQHSIASLTMDKLVKELPYSKGTIYSHFVNKEDLLLGLCNQHMGALAELFTRAASFNGCLRERALAINIGYMLYAKLNPTQFMLVITAKTSNITDKASEQREQKQMQIEGALFAPIGMIFQQAMEAGEIDPPTAMTVEQVAFSCWSLNFGVNALLLQNVSSCGARSSLSLEHELLNNINLLFDGLKFKPLSTDFNWKKTISRLKEEVFEKEMSELLARGLSLAI